MKRRLLNLCLIAGLLSFGSCEETDLSGLQDQIDGLTEQVGEMEKAQQDALLAQIAALQALITDLQADNSELSTDYTSLLEKLEALQADVAADAKLVHYGDVLTDAEFAAIAESGASIVTGKVFIASEAHADALANVKMIGGSLEIAGGINIDLTSIENVAGDLLISGVNEVTAPKLVSVGGNFDIKANKSVTSVIADELVLIFGKFTIEDNAMLNTVSFAKLDMIGELFINNYDENDPDEFGFGQLVNLELSDADVRGDVYATCMAMGSTLSLGSIGGNFTSEWSGVGMISLQAETHGGDLIISNNMFLAELVLDNLTRIEGDLSVNQNSLGSAMRSTKMGMGGAVYGLTTLAAFDALEFIGGDVYISGNNSLTDMIAFNNVTEVAGGSIVINEMNGQTKSTVTIFNALVSTGSAGSNESGYADITIDARMDWFTGFQVLENANEVDLQFDMPSANTALRVDGFDAMTEVKTLTLALYFITEFNAFPVLDNFTNGQQYLEIILPYDDTVGLCSMESILTKVSDGEFDTGLSRVAVFREPAKLTEMDRDEALFNLMSPCYGNF